MIYKISKHASAERLERFMYIVMEVGIGEEIASVPTESGKREILTDTGVLLVLSNDNLVITAYVANFDKIFSIWQSAHGDNARMPTWLYERFTRNERHYQGSQFDYYKDERGKYKFKKKSKNSA